MKKFAVVSLSLVLLVFAFAACGKKAGLPVAGSAKAEDMLSLIPKDVQGIVVIDANRGMNTAFIDKAIKSGDEYAEYLEITQAAGIDPQKDVYFAAIGVVQKKGPDGEDASQGMGVINLKYDQARLVALMKEKQPNFKEMDYEGVTLFTGPEENEGKPMIGAFLDASNIALGTEAGVKAVIDLYQGKGESVLDNPAIAPLLKTANKAAILWAVFALTPDQVKGMTSETPMLQSLESITGATMFMDYKSQSLQVEIKALSSDPAKNKEIADFLNGLKALGSMISGEEPALGELIAKVDVSSGPDHVKLFVDLPEELMNKLGEKAKETVKSKLDDGSDVEDKTDEEIIRS